SDAPSKPAATEMMAFVARKVFTRPIAKNMKEIQRNVVVVFAGGGYGSGFVIDDAGHILTNEHVVRAAQRVKVRFESRQEETAAVLATDARRDVALLKIDRAGTAGLPIGFDPAAVGDTVYAVGAPLDPTYSATVSKGIVSGVRELDDETWIQSDVNVQHGSSGGPLLDDRGNVIGMTARGAPNEAGAPSGVNFFVPIADALKRLGLNPTRGTAG
ncbi:MAG TPA: S1C family serine protease, partial [Candidatus Angelobacter sp.]|nr:S1C family serine protease [Candidatus Angelobacter sp.]